MRLCCLLPLESGEDTKLSNFNFVTWVEAGLSTFVLWLIKRPILLCVSTTDVTAWTGNGVDTDESYEEEGDAKHG